MSMWSGEILNNLQIIIKPYFSSGNIHSQGHLIDGVDAFYLWDELSSIERFCASLQKSGFKRSQKTFFISFFLSFIEGVAWGLFLRDRIREFAIQAMHHLFQDPAFCLEFQFSLVHKFIKLQHQTQNKTWIIWIFNLFLDIKSTIYQIVNLHTELPY